jgi:hypothetical protein
MLGVMLTPAGWPQRSRWRRKVALPFLFLLFQVFSVFSKERFLTFCMGNFKSRSKLLFSFSFSFSGFSQFSLFSSTLPTPGRPYKRQHCSGQLKGKRILARLVTETIQVGKINGGYLCYLCRLVTLTPVLVTFVSMLL